MHSESSQTSQSQKTIFSEGLNSLLERNNASVDYFRPPDKLTVSQWADRKRYISDKNAEPGKWRTDRAPYQREMMDAMSDPSVREVTLKTSSQVGKTASLENALGFYIDQDPCSVIMMHPTADDCKDWSMFKFEPMIESCPDLLSKIAPPRSRNSVNTKTRKEYPGGFIMLIGSNATRAMRGRSAPKSSVMKSMITR